MGYPSLSTVPPRPQLSYPVQQRRAIVEGLIADLENARYTSQVVRFRSGQSDLPPPPEPPRIPAAVAEAIVGPDRAAPADGVAPDAAAPGAVIDDAPLYFGDGDDDGNLSDFIRDMVRETAPQPAPSPAIPEAPPAAEPVAPEPQAYEVPTGARTTATSGGVAPAPAVTLATHGGEPAPRQPDARASEPPVGVRRSVAPVPRLRPEPPAAALATAPVPAPRPAPPEATPAEVALVAPPEPPDPADQAAASPDETPPGQIQARLIAFAPGSADLTPAVEPELASVLADAERIGLVIDIIGEAKDPALALERARAVALALIKLGAGTDRLRIGADPEPSGDRAWIILADPL